MIIERKITINKIDYYLGFKVKYNNRGKISKIDNTYFDLGDISTMINYIQNNYNETEKYDNQVQYMNDIIYLYDRFPFVEYIKDISSDKDGKVNQIGYIDNNEIKRYIADMHIEINRWDKNDIPCPMLYK